MQIIQTIREKGAIIIIVVIALSLIGFLLMDAKQGSNPLFGSNTVSVGSVNGDKIEIEAFNQKVNEAHQLSSQQKRQENQMNGLPSIDNIREQIWNQTVGEKVLINESKKLGFDFTQKEFSRILLSNNNRLNPLIKTYRLVDSATGKLDMAKAQNFLNEIKSLKKEQKKDFEKNFIDPLKLNATEYKYSGLLNSSVYYPTWMQESESNDAIRFANISYVQVPYTDISDSLITISDQDVQEHINRNKERFKMEEEGRAISYLSFSQKPSLSDSLNLKKLLLELKNDFESDTNTKTFILKNVSAIPYLEYDYYLPREKFKELINDPFFDTISNVLPGKIYGPFNYQKYQGGITIAKYIGYRNQPDSVKARHILIPSDNNNSASDKLAKQKADSIYNAILSGADFAQMAKQFSSDPGSKENGGDLGAFPPGVMISEFNEFCFTQTPGSRGVVKTKFGYHIIEVLSHINPKTAYKFAFLGKGLSASEETINTANTSALRASAEKSKTQIETYAKKNNLSIVSIPALLKQNDYSAKNEMGGEILKDIRPIVKWAFGAKQGDVSEPFIVGDQFVVVILDKVVPKGYLDVFSVKKLTQEEAAIKNYKKARIIASSIGTNPTLESAASTYSKQILTAGADSTLIFGSSPNYGSVLQGEPKVIGASFNPSYQSKTSPVIEGRSGAYILKVNAINNKPTESAEAITERKKTRTQALRYQTQNWYEGLKKSYEIIDERSKYY